MNVLVSSKVTKSGSTISGDISQIVVIRINAGYQPDPGHPGTGTVIRVLCSSLGAAHGYQTAHLRRRPPRRVSSGRPPSAISKRREQDRAPIGASFLPMRRLDLSAALHRHGIRHIYT
jgi:hypothetical protein